MAAPELKHDLSPYQVRSRQEILLLLRALCDRGQLLSMLLDNDEKPVITTILAVDANDSTVIIDCARSREENESIVACSNISFETTLDSIRILFFASRAEKASFDDSPALRFALPTNLIRLQRREFFRLATPISNPVHCEIQIPDQPKTGKVSLTLQNVSGGGIAILDEHKNLDVTIGRVYHDCKIDLPGGSLIVTKLQIRNVQEVQMKNDRTVRRIGCLFVDLPQPMLAAIQRYITRLQREQNARANGLV